MKKKLILILAFAFVLGFSYGSVQAASVSLLPSSQDVAPGDSFFLDIVYDFTDDATYGGGVDITFDDTILNYGNFSFSSATSAWDITRDPDISTGLVSGLAAGTSAGGITGPVTIGTLFFSADLSVVPIVSTVLELRESLDPAVGGFFSSVTNTAQDPTMNSATVNVVPIPGSILLLGSGLVGLIGIARRKRS